MSKNCEMTPLPFSGDFRCARILRPVEVNIQQDCYDCSEDNSRVQQ